MADDVPITAGVGTAVATDEIAARHFQRMKFTLGVDGVNDGDVSSSNPMPAREQRPSAASYQLLGCGPGNNVLLASNANRLGGMILNQTDRSLYLKEGALAASNSFTIMLMPGEFHLLPFPVYTGQIDGYFDGLPYGNVITTEKT